MYVERLRKQKYQFVESTRSSLLSQPVIRPCNLDNLDFHRWCKVRVASKLAK